MLERPTVNRRPEQLLFRPTTDQVNKQLCPQDVRTSSLVDRRPNAADPTLLHGLGIIDHQPNRHSRDAFGGTLTPDRAVTTAAVAVDMERTFATALTTDARLRRPLAHPADRDTIDLVRQDPFVATGWTDPFLGLFITAMTQVLFMTEFFTHRLGLVTVDANDQSPMHLVTQRTDRFVSFGPGRDHPLLTADTALLPVLRVTSTLRTDGLIMLVAESHDTRMSATTTRWPRLTRAFIALRARRLIRLAVDVDIGSVVTTNATTLQWARLPLTPRTQR